MENKTPLSPHIQIYRWHISSLVSITHRITGVINIIGITFICIWSCLLILGENNYEVISAFRKSPKKNNTKKSISYLINAEGSIAILACQHGSTDFPLLAFGIYFGEF